MGNAIKNYQKKQRKEVRNAMRELKGIVANAVVKRCGYPEEILERTQRDDYFVENKHL